MTENWQPWHIWDRSVGFEVHRGEPTDSDHDRCQPINTENTEGDCFTGEMAIRIVADHKLAELAREAYRVFTDPHSLEKATDSWLSKWLAEFDVNTEVQG